jgi:hypothetical protein
MPRYSYFKYPNERRVHVFIVIRYLEADQPLAEERLSVFSQYLVTMDLIHDEYDVGPPDLFVIERVAGVVVGARGRNLEVLPCREHLLGGGTAQLVLTADEQHTFHADLILVEEATDTIGSV